MQQTIRFKLNGQDQEYAVEPNVTLLELIRGKCGITSPKQSCERGECGSCTVLLNGKAVNGCLVLAVSAHGKDVLTVESLGGVKTLHPLQKHFAELGASQCGYCTPGMILSAKYLLDHNPSPSVADIKKGISGNLCRCTGYVKIIEAIQAAAREMHNTAASH